jgi:hypothetical protein
VPNVTIFIASEQMPSPASLAALSDDCAELCISVLAAAPENVHVISVGVHHGRGHPAFADIRYRLEPSRTPAVMERFMADLDDAITRHAGLTARIRCFGYPSPNLYARN